jgi:hypothetical protein
MVIDPKKKPTTFVVGFLVFGAAGRNRTHDPLVRSQVLYPAELQPHHALNYSKLLRASLDAAAIK